MSKIPIYALALLNVIFLCMIGCSDPDQSQVIVYTALDQGFSEPILDDFTKQSGIQVRAVYDIESTKTVGLTQRILREAKRPRCDLFWNNEILNTIRLQEQGLLRIYQSPRGKKFPARYRSSDGYWFGFAARARVILVNTNLVPENKIPDSIFDLTDPQWKGKIGLAKPLFGTTATHATCLFAYLGDEKAKNFFNQLKENEVQILAGNKTVAENVAAGQLAFGLTDTDDAIIELGRGAAVKIIYPDQKENQIGTLLIPNTIALIKGSPNEKQAERLAEYLLSEEVETKLAAGRSAQIPLNPENNTLPRGNIRTLKTLRTMEIDFQQAAKHWTSTAKFLKATFSLKP